MLEERGHCAIEIEVGLPPLVGEVNHRGESCSLVGVLVEHAVAPGQLWRVLKSVVPACGGLNC